MEEFIRFIDEDLAPAGINLLILRVDWNYEYRKHPELRDENPLTGDDAEKLAAACRRNGIRLVPQVNLLGHQSWAKETHALLREYPQFDENPSVKTEYYSGWPNPYGLYCKSYCPLHPDVHGVVFDVVDEICDAFHSDAFHAGMDEVFYIGEDECPRCHGKDRSELFAGGVEQLVARRAHNPEVGGSSPPPATTKALAIAGAFFCYRIILFLPISAKNVIFVSAYKLKLPIDYGFHYRQPICRIA